MIRTETIEQINQTAQIEEVIGDFLQLKKRGANLLGNCPFHNEKSPSFTVSPSKGIYKCFGCGKAGNSVNFVMEHEKYSYPEALRYLARKYNIEIVEEVQTDEEKQKATDREGLYLVSEFARDFYSNLLHETEEGQTIGLSYFKERSFRTETIRKFELGYAPSGWDNLSLAAVKQGNNPDFLEATGLSVKHESGKLNDRFRSRVMFPIHNMSGRVIGFGGRVLATDSKTAKYINSPESEIYHKSDVLYGAYFARKRIKELDVCYLVEGYTDVVSLHQAGIENVVASSGTSLTIGQIKVISRLTQNIVILYDGDIAGIKASLRGMEMILEEGLNVKIVLFPDGNDPDSFIRKQGSTAFENYLSINKQDFIVFKTNLLIKETQNDPIKKAELIRDLVETIAKIPDPIKASVFIQECSILLQTEEQLLLNELNKIRRKKLSKNYSEKNEEIPVSIETEVEEILERKGIEVQEEEVIRILLNYGSFLLPQTEDEKKELIPPSLIAEFVCAQMEEFEFENPVCKLVIQEFNKAIKTGAAIPSQQYFIENSDSSISNLAISLLSSRYMLSENWFKMHNIPTPTEEEILENMVFNGIYHLKLRKVQGLMNSTKNEMKKNNTVEDEIILQNHYIRLKKLEIELSKLLGAVIVK